MTDNFTVLDIETSGNSPWEGDLLAVGLGGVVYPPSEGLAAAQRVLNDTSAIVVCHTTYDLRWMILAGCTMADGVRFHDTKLMAWTLDATQSLTLDDVTERYCNFRPDKRITSRGGRIVFRLDDGEYVPIADAPWDQMQAYNQSDIDSTATLYTTLRGEMQRRGMWDAFEAEEVPFSRLLVEIETTGLPIDVPDTLRLRDRVAEQAAELRQEVVAAVGLAEFNPGSPNQMSDYLYGDLFSLPSRIAIPRMNGIPKDEKVELAQQLAPENFRVDKVGRDFAHGRYVIEGRGLKAPKLGKDKAPNARPSTNSTVLTVMHIEDPWVARYLEWRKVDKIVTGFLNVWPEQVHNGRLYGRLDQSGTVTGRLAGREPNLQNIPARSDLGAEVRGLFRGPLIVGDYSGLEVRLSAHFSGDPTMLDIFLNERDLYGVLASNAWGGPATKDNARRALMKVVMLGSQYGAQGDKLANVMAVNGFRGHTARQADNMLKELQETLPRLFEWREEIIQEARSLGYITTLGERRRLLPDINSAVWKAQALAERQAVNSKVQGSAADVVRRAMLACRSAVAPTVARQLLQIHDEIIWERGHDWDDAALPVLRDACETGHGFDLRVPLKFEPTKAASWAEKG